MIDKKGTKPCGDPDISNFTDDMMGPMIGVDNEEPKIKMITGKKKIIRMVQPKKTEEIEAEEENEEGELDSDLAKKEPMIKSSKKRIAPKPSTLSNQEQAVSHGLNPDSKSKPQKFDHFKVVHPSDIPRIVARGVESRDPVSVDMRTVKQLPKEVRSPIRALSRHLFGVLTNTSINDVQVIAHVKGKGPNSMAEFNAVYKWLDLSGQQNHALIKDLQTHIHGLKMYNTEGITHLVVRNTAGHYVFSWPSLDNKITESSK